jgi:hypothetical protein
MRTCRERGRDPTNGELVKRNPGSCGSSGILKSWKSVRVHLFSSIRLSFYSTKVSPHSNYACAKWRCSDHISIC